MLNLLRLVKFGKRPGDKPKTALGKIQDGFLLYIQVNDVFRVRLNEFLSRGDVTAH